MDIEGSWRKTRKDVTSSFFILCVLVQLNLVFEKIIISVIALIYKEI
jgi:hypothetical protein